MRRSGPPTHMFDERHTCTSECKKRLASLFDLFYCSEVSLLPGLLFLKRAKFSIFSQDFKSYLVLMSVLLLHFL